MQKFLGLLLLSSVALSAPEEAKTSQQSGQGNTRFFNQGFGSGLHSGGRPIGGHFPGRPIGGQFPGRPIGGQFPGRPVGGQFPGRPIGGQFPGVGGQFPGVGGHFPGVGGHFPGVGGQFPGVGGQFPGVGGHFPGVGGVSPVRPPVATAPGCLTAGPVSPPKGNCQKWKQDTCGNWICDVSQKAFECPRVRPQCPPTRFQVQVGPQACHNDNDCAFNDKCCVDACFPHLICKGPE